MATLINGNLNNPVYASQDADLLAAICGNKTVVTPVGSQFAEELEDANTIKVDDGVIITKEGRRIQLDNGDIDEFLIPTGTQGQTNYYICGYHLYTDEESAELCETFVEPVSSATDTIDEDTFRDGATEVYVSLLRVKQEGVNITAITRLLSSGTDMNQINVGLSAEITNRTSVDATKVNISDIVNSLTSTATNKPLSANQGKVLNDGKINISDIVNNLTSSATNKPLSAAQGKAINDRFVFNTLLTSEQGTTITLKTNKLYLVVAHGIGDKARIGVASTVYTTHFTNLIGESTLYLNWGASGNNITFINKESTTIGLSITEL